MLSKNDFTDIPPFQLPLPLTLLTESARASATTELKTFVVDIASDISEQTGLTWRSADSEAQTCKELHHQVAAAHATKKPLAIDAARADFTLLMDEHAALSLRFWRLITKVRRVPCHCNAASEVAVNNDMLDLALQFGVSELAQKYLYAELMGNTFLRLSGYGISIAPAMFTLDVVALGVPEAIVLEDERRAARAR